MGQQQSRSGASAKVVDDSVSDPAGLLRPSHLLCHCQQHMSAAYQPCLPPPHLVALLSKAWPALLPCSVTLLQVTKKRCCVMTAILLPLQSITSPTVLTLLAPHLQVSPVCVLCEAEAGKPWRDMSKDERKQFKQEGRTFTCRGCRTPKRTPSVASMVSCPCLLLCNARLHAASTGTKVPRCSAAVGQT